ncbi:oligosaccharide flippase family protein [Natrinema sp. H-ect4]|uniref:oligosaccharide flippase family protein n=1 Tax=Natrinema sp. H-ect4 TaxID=3242699 RepID=UPI0035A88B2A
MLDVDHLKNLFRLTSIYSGGKIGVAVIGFALYPVYTQYLTPANFGIIGLALLVGNGARHLFTIGLNAAAFNFYHRYEGMEREEFYTTLFAFIVLLSVGWLVLFELFGPWFFERLLGVAIYDPYLRIILLATAITAVLHVIPKHRFKAAEEAEWFVLMDSGKNLSNHLVRLILIVGFSFGVTGYLLGSLAGAVIVGAGGLTFILRRVIPRFSMEKLREALVYSVPLFPHFYSHFIISMADRVLLTRLGSLGAVGVYTIGYTLAQALQMVVTSANSAIMPEFARAGDNRDAFERLPVTATYYLLFSATAALGMILFLPAVIRAFFPMDYHAAIDLIPWLGLAFFSVALYYVPMNVLSQTQRNTRIVPLLTITAAGVNIGLNLLLIPPFGITGAALSTLAAYLVLAIAVFVYSQRLNRVPYELRRTGILVGVLLALTVGEMALPVLSLGLNVAVRVIIFTAFFVLITFAGFWNNEEWAAIRGAATRVRSRFG